MAPADRSEAYLFQKLEHSLTNFFREQVNIFRFFLLNKWKKLRVYISKMADPSSH